MSRLRWSPDGGRLLVAATDSSFQVRALQDVASGRPKLAPHCFEAAACWAWSPLAAVGDRCPGPADVGLCFGKYLCSISITSTSRLQ